MQEGSEKTASADVAVGPHSCTHVAPSALHAFAHVVLGEMHPERNVPRVHTWFMHVLLFGQLVHAAPE
jgi:hypothetical protein